MAKVLGQYKSATEYENGANKVPADVQTKYKAQKTKVAGHFKNNPIKATDPAKGSDKNYVTVTQDGDKYTVECYVEGKKDSTIKLN